MEIRTATEADAEALAAYASRLFSEDLPGIFAREAPSVADEVEFIRSRVTPANATMLLAVEDGAVVGIVDFEGRRHPQEAHCGAFGLSVDRERRGQGIGTRLIEALLAWAPSAGITRVESGAFATNPDALRLYERLGFEREGVRRGGVVIAGEPVDVTLLVRHVADRV